MTAPVSPPQPRGVAALAHYVEMRTKEPMLNLGGSVHAIHLSTEYAAEITFFDIADAVNSHASLKARAEQAEQAVDVLESNAREQAKLLADTGRRVEDLEGALLAAREYVAGASLAAGTPAYIRCCELLIKIDGALAINSQHSDGEAG